MCQVLSITEDKQFWIDASPDTELSCNLMYVNQDGELIKETKQEVFYLDNNIWEGTIKAPNQSVIIIGTISIKGKTIETIFTVNYNLYGCFIYLADFHKTNLDIEWLQLNEEAEVIDYDKLIEIKNGFYLGKLNKKVPSLICVEDECNIFKPSSEYTNLKECLELNENLTLKYIMLEKQLKEIESYGNNKTPGKIVVNASDLSTSINIKNTSKTNTVSVKKPSTKTASTLKSSTTSTTTKSSLSHISINTTLK